MTGSQKSVSKKRKVGRWSDLNVTKKNVAMVRLKIENYYISEEIT